MKKTFDDELSAVIVHNDKQLQNIKIDNAKMNSEVEKSICQSEELLRELGHTLPHVKAHKRETLRLNDMERLEWDDVVAEAEKCVEGKVSIEQVFTKDELAANEEFIVKLREDFNAIHRLDAIDWTIPIVAGILGGIIDIVLVGIPERTKQGTSAGPLSDYIRGLFDKTFPPEEMEKLANSKISKTPFDAQDNRNTKVYVEGLSAYYHRLLELGHDPILAFIVGVLDVLKGTMTTIDKKGKIVIQALDCYADRGESNLFVAIAKVLRHLKSDVTTSMGLPAPLMGLFNLFQFGSIGEFEQTIAEIVQGMYYEGYDFIHFCSMSIPTIITEVIVRVAYGIKMKKEGHSLKESVAFTSNRQKHPKLGTELFLAHTAATAINAGKVYVSENPLAINYPQWIAFAKYSIAQLKWTLIKKPEMRYKYVQDILDEEWLNTYNETESLWKEFNNG